MDLAVSPATARARPASIHGTAGELAFIRIETLNVLRPSRLAPEASPSGALASYLG